MPHAPLAAKRFSAQFPLPAIVLHPTVISAVLVLACLSGLAWILQRTRRKASEILTESTKNKKEISWSIVGLGMLFIVYGIAAMITGRTSVSYADVAGMNVRIAGAAISVIGVLQMVFAFLGK